MKALLILMLALAPFPAKANEFERRNAINEAREQEEIRQGEEREKAEYQASLVQYIAAILCVDPSQIRGSYGDWTTADGVYACGVVDGFGAGEIRCLGPDGHSVGKFDDNGRPITCGGSQGKSKRVVKRRK